MKLLSLTAALVTGAIALSSITVFAQSSSDTSGQEQVRFVCGQSYHPAKKQRVPTTFQWTPTGKRAIIQWSSDALSNAGFTPQARCEKVSPNFQKAYDNGSLNFITNALVNKQRAICSVRATDGACDTVLFTLRPQDNSVAVLQQLNELWDGTASGPLEQSSGESQVYIDVRPFFRPTQSKPINLPSR